MSGSRKRKLEFTAQDEAYEEKSNVGAKLVTRSSKDKASIVYGGQQRSTPRRRVSGSEGDVLPPKLFKVECLVTSKISGSLYLVFEYMEHDLSGLALRPGVKFT